MAQKESEKWSDKEIVAAALNEQGFLLAQIVREEVKKSDAFESNWGCVATEFPVTASDDSQTRIDLVLRYHEHQGLHLCVECKRAHPKYKKWVFFDPGETNVYIETCRRTGPCQPGSSLAGAIQMTRWGAPVFDAYIESAVDRNGKVSHTETIEKAFVQVIAGHTGLMAKFSLQMPSPAWCSVPLVVTTAQLFEADFKIENVSKELGTIDPHHLELKPLPFCAVNFHSSDSLALKPLSNTQSPFPIEEALRKCFIRTIFVASVAGIPGILKALAGCADLIKTRWWGPTRKSLEANEPYSPGQRAACTVGSIPGMGEARRCESGGRHARPRFMKTLAKLICIVAAILCSAAADPGAMPKLKVAADGYPSGNGTPEGAACDLARAFIKRDVTLFTNTCIRHYGPPAYASFLTNAVAKMKAEEGKSAPAPGGPKSIGKVFAARRLTNNGPVSYGYAAFDFQDIMFADVGVFLHDGGHALHRTLLIKDRNGKWYVHPMPMVSPLLSAGLNEEAASIKDFSEAYEIQR